jgi:hypothetical protein
VAGTVTRLTAGISGSTLQAVNNGEGTALDLRVGPSTTTPTDKTIAPMKVDSQAKVANFNADEVDGQDASSFAASSHTHSGEGITGGTVAEARIAGSAARDEEVLPVVRAGDGAGSGLDADQFDGKESSAFLASGAKAADADSLDGLDSTTFGIATQHNRQDLEECYTRPPDPKGAVFPRQLCAPVQVVVPPGKKYVVSAWSSFSIFGSWADTQTTQMVRYCSGMKAPGQPEANCVTPFGARNKITAQRREYVAASTSGETLPLTEGTYTFGTIVMPELFDLVLALNSPGDVVVTKVMVRDAAAPQPTGVSIP